MPCLYALQKREPFARVSLCVDTIHLPVLPSPLLGTAVATFTSLPSGSCMHLENSFFFKCFLFYSLWHIHLYTGGLRSFGFDTAFGPLAFCCLEYDIKRSLDELSFGLLFPLHFWSSARRGGGFLLQISPFSFYIPNQIHTGRQTAFCTTRRGRSIVEVILTITTIIGKLVHIYMDIRGGKQQPAAIPTRVIRWLKSMCHRNVYGPEVERH